MSKDDQCLFWGVVSGVGIIAAATTLVVATGGTALLAGGIGLGAALSGQVNVIQQAVSDKKEFDGKSFVANVVIGGATSVISVGAGSVASNIASKCALEGGKKLATQVGIQAVGGAISSSAGNCIQTKVNGGEIKAEQIIQAAVCGIVSAGIGSGIGGATNSIISKTVTDKAQKVAVGIVGGAVGGGAASFGQQVVSNLCQGQEWDYDCASAAFNGIVIGGIAGGISAGRDIKLKSEEQPKLSKEMIYDTDSMDKLDKKGPFEEKVYKWVDPASKETYYIKQYNLGGNMDQMKINEKLSNYQQAAQLGTGPAVQIEGNFVVVKGQTMLLDAIAQNKITKAEAAAQIDKLNSQMKQECLQHCDVKPTNLIFNEKSKQIQLIDNGDMAHFGEKRSVGTDLGKSINYNADSELSKGHTVTETTDKRGIQMTKSRINVIKTGNSTVSDVGKHEALRFKASNVRALRKENEEEDE